MHKRTATCKHVRVHVTTGLYAQLLHFSNIHTPACTSNEKSCDKRLCGAVRQIWSHKKKRKKETRQQRGNRQDCKNQHRRRDNIRTLSLKVSRQNHRVGAEPGLSAERLSLVRIGVSADYKLGLMERTWMKRDK